MRTIQALLTDLDGTLIHSVDPICDALHECFLHVGATPPAKQQLVDMFGLPVEVMLTELSEVQPSETARIAEFIAEYKRQYPVHMEQARLIPGALETLRALYAQGVKICLITSERRQNAAHILHRLGLDKYIHFIISRDDVEHFKPHPEPLLRAAALVGEGPSACAYIGESPFDIAAGVASGVYTVAVPSGTWSRSSLLEQHPHAFIQNICDLTGLVAGPNI